MSEPTAKVLVIEDDPTLARALLINLRARGFDAHTSRTGSDGMAVLERIEPDVVILDLGLPDMDGSEVISAVRRWNTVPVIVLSARAEGSEKVKLLGLGADDYVTKPFQVEELVARINAAARRGALTRRPTTGPVISTADFTIDLTSATVTKDGQQIRLTPTEWHMLEVLAQAPNTLVTRHELLQAVWGEGYERESHYLRIYVSQLRHKIEPDPTNPRYLITEPGMGYRLRLQP